MPEATNIVRNASTYARDLAERVIWTFITALAAVVLAAGPADMFSASFWESAGAAGLAAVCSFVKGLLARLVGDRNSASMSMDV